MDVIRLRKLSFKSKLNFGKHHYLTVEFILNNKREGDKYLRYVYFNYSNIDFLPDVLKALKIDDRDLLDKQATLKRDPKIKAKYYDFEQKIKTDRERNMMKGKEYRSLKVSLNKGRLKSYNQKT